MFYETLKAPSAMGRTTVARLSKRTGLTYLAWQTGKWSAWHIALRADLSKLKCSNTYPKNAPVNTSNAVVFGDICENCLINLARELK